MRVHPGVFVSNVMTDDWRPDPEVDGEMHVLVEEETAYAGMSRFTKNQEMTSRQTIIHHRRLGEPSPSHHQTLLGYEPALSGGAVPTQLIQKSHK